MLQLCGLNYKRLIPGNLSCPSFIFSFKLLLLERMYDFFDILDLKSFIPSFSSPYLGYLFQKVIFFHTDLGLLVFLSSICCGVFVADLLWCVLSLICCDG